MTTYTWREGSRPGGVDANVAGKELERIRKANAGKLQAETVVEESTPEAAPLHPAFEWDNDVAAHKWRVNQSRNLIRSVRIEQKDGADEPAYVHVKVENPSDDGGQNYYQSTRVAVQSVGEWAAAMLELTRRVSALRHSLDDLRHIAQEKGEEPSAVISIVERMLDTVDAAISRLAG